MPEPKALTPEQINLLRGLPSGGYNSMNGKILRRRGLATKRNWPDYTFERTDAGDALLATIDAERERVLGEVDELAGRHSMLDVYAPGETDSKWRVWVAAQPFEGDTFTQALLAANPNQPTEGEK